MALIELDHVSKSYQVGQISQPALRHVSVDIEAGRLVTFVGPSGSGKTTLLNLIGCMDRPSSGRITSLQSATGGVFNNADIMRLDFHVEYDVRAMEDREDVYFLDLKAKNQTVAYDRLEMTVDKVNLVPVEVKCLTATDMLIKTLYFKQITDFGNGIVRPAVIETDSPLHQGYRSVMIFSQITPRDLPDEVFTLNYMPRLEGLRK